MLVLISDPALAALENQLALRTRTREPVSVKDFGAIGDCVADDTAAIQAALNASDRIRIPKPAVCYRVSAITVGKNKTVLTDGLATVIKQIAGQTIGTRVINITGSNVRVGSLSVSGNISTDENEQHHAVFVHANAATGDIEKITLEDIHGADIRGDVLYVGQAKGYSVKHIKAGNISGDNIFRNVVSFVSGAGLTIGSITGSRVGFSHFDAEPNVGSGPAVDVRINYIKGRLVGLSGQTVADYIDSVSIDIMDLDPAHSSQSIPSYKPGAAISDALTLRNVRSARIGQFIVNGFNRSAMFTVSNPGEMGAKRIAIEHAKVTNCAISDSTYKTFFNLSATYLELTSLDAEISGDRSLFSNGNLGGRISNATVNIGAGSSFIKSSKNFSLTNIRQSGSGIFINGGGSHTVTGGSITGTRLSSFGTPSTFEGVTATSSEFVFDGRNNGHTVRNSTLKMKNY
jgi:hypothetical protein